MKLRLKIFISILFVTLAALSLSSYYLINRNHLDNVARELERSINEFDLICTSVENEINFGTDTEDTIKLLFSRYAQYYAGRGIFLMEYRNKAALYKEFTAISQEGYAKLLSDKKASKQAQVIGENGKYYIFVSYRPLQGINDRIIYARDISDIYLSRTRSIYLSVLLASALIVLLGFLSYLYSRWITKPIEILHRGANAVSQGDYTIHMPDTGDEFNDLGKAFNQMASAVENRTAQLEERAKDLQVFIDDLSHEMSTPLTSIQGYSEFLLSANASGDQKHKAALTIKKETKRMKDIYDKLMLLTFTREQKPELTPVAVSEVFGELSDTFSLQLQEQNISLTVQNELESISIDRILIHILLGNLINNSIQALPKGGNIDLKAYLSDDRPVLEVKDNGNGIPEDKISEIIRPFYRVDKSRSRKTGGAGLGLSICKSIADMHQSELRIISKEGIGTSIQLIFPGQGRIYNSVTTSL